MKISEFAQKNQVTAKMLRHYDDLGLLKPANIDPENGYRSYEESQSHLLNWILILKNLGFSLSEIKTLLAQKLSAELLIRQLVLKRIEISGALNEQILKRIQIDRLIQLIEQEGFTMEREIDLMTLSETGIHEIKKYMPNTEMFLETAKAILAEDSLEAYPYFCVLRTDLCNFKIVNDLDGYEAGDKVIVAFYKAVQRALDSFGCVYAIGRAGGDEFTILMKGEAELFHEVGQEIVSQLGEIDFIKMGIHKQIHLYVGGLYAELEKKQHLRTIIDETHEALLNAKKMGEDSIHLTKY